MPKNAVASSNEPLIVALPWAEVAETLEGSGGASDRTGLEP